MPMSVKSMYRKKPQLVVILIGAWCWWSPWWRRSCWPARTWQTGLPADFAQAGGIRSR